MIKTILVVSLNLGLCKTTVPLQAAPKSVSAIPKPALPIEEIKKPILFPSPKDKNVEIKLENIFDGSGKDLGGKITLPETDLEREIGVRP